MFQEASNNISSNNLGKDQMKRGNRVNREEGVIDSRISNILHQQAAIYRIQDKGIVEEDSKEAINNMSNSRFLTYSN
jgi:hypothetical protein